MPQFEYNFFTYLGSPFFKRIQANLNLLHWIITSSELMNSKYVTSDIILKFEKKFIDWQNLVNYC